MKTYPCYYNRCPMNSQDPTVSKDRICTASLEVWSRCLRQISWNETEEAKNFRELMNKAKTDSDDSYGKSGALVSDKESRKK